MDYHILEKQETIKQSRKIKTIACWEKTLLAVLATFILQISSADAQFASYFGPNGAYFLEVWMYSMDTVRFRAVVPNNQYFSIGLGGLTMSKCDMVIWQANGAQSSKVVDLWSTGHSTPSTDASQDYNNTIDFNGTHVTFISDRKLNTGDSKDYVIPLVRIEKMGDSLFQDKKIGMNYAYVSRTSSLIEHSRSAFGTFYMTLATPKFTSNGSTSQGPPNITIDSSSIVTADSMNKVDIMLVHGWVLWAAWGILGMIQILSIRYLTIFSCCSKISKNVKMALHIINGLVILAATIVMCIKAIEFESYTLNWDDVHSAMGLIILFVTCGIVVLGFLAWGAHTYKSSSFWSYFRFLQIKSLHKYLGYGLIITSQIATLLGVMAYNEETENPTLGAINLGAFLLFWGFLEGLYQFKMRENKVLELHLIKISVHEFDQRLRKGAKYVILDDLVLDIEEYIETHPGGKGFLERNIGRDISKFFYGGYAMGKAYPYSHSQSAVLICKKLAIARLDASCYTPKEAAPVFKAAMIDRQEVVADSVYTVTFSAQGKDDIGYPELKKHYSDLEMIGRHFLIYDVKQGKKRQYTICNCMQPMVYAELLRVISDFKDGKKPHFKNELLYEGNSNQVCITLKNYKIKDGLSTLICSDKINSIVPQYHIKGPMGKGIDLNVKGAIHIAFSGGTGILPYIDLVAFLIRYNLDLLTEVEKQMYHFPPQFKFVLYVSYPTIKDAIARDLCLGLVDICRAKNLNNFEYVERISGSQLSQGSAKVPQWDDKFIKTTLKQYFGYGISKIWVCGPPRMNETFESALLSLAEEFHLNPLVDIDIM